MGHCLGKLLAWEEKVSVYKRKEVHPLAITHHDRFTYPAIVIHNPPDALANRGSRLEESNKVSQSLFEGWQHYFLEEAWCCKILEDLVCQSNILEVAACRDQGHNTFFELDRKPRGRGLTHSESDDVVLSRSERKVSRKSVI